MAPRSTASTETRARILQAALERFTEHGYHATTMDDIAVASETSKGTLYWYFDSKDALLEAAIHAVFEKEFGEEVFFAALEGQPPAEKLRALGRSMAAFAAWAEGLFSLFLEFWTSSDRKEQVSVLWLDLLEQYKGSIVAIIESGVEHGDFRAVEAEPLVWAVMAVYDGLAAYRMLKPDLELTRISRVFIDTLLTGLESDAGGEDDV
jgi:AcrR family transcriptional regulator